jgi:hypothetical protein
MNFLDFQGQCKCSYWPAPSLYLTNKLSCSLSVWPECLVAQCDCQWTATYSSKNCMVSHSTRVQYILKLIVFKTYTNRYNYISVKMSFITVDIEIFTGTELINNNCFINKLFESPSSSCHVSLHDNILISIFCILEY